MSDSKPEKPITMHPHPLPPVPEGMSKSQWKKVWKKKRFEETKDEFAKIRREKRQKAKETRRAKIQEYLDRGEEVPEDLRRKPRKNQDQKDSGINIILDCAFDDLMNDKEVVSLSTQITRAYSHNKRENHFAKVKVTSFNKRLRTRFEEGLKDAHHDEWKNFEFTEDPTLPRKTPYTSLPIPTKPSRSWSRVPTISWGALSTKIDTNCCATTRPVSLASQPKNCL